MVVKFTELRDDTDVVEVGRIHDGKILVSRSDSFQGTVERIRSVAADSFRRQRTRTMRGVDTDGDPASRRHEVRRRPPLNLYDEDSIIQRYDSPYGAWGTVSYPEADRERLEAYAARDPSVTTPHRPESTRDVAIRLFLWGRDGPNRLVRIFGDGFTRLDIRGDTPLAGRYVFQLPEEAVNDLVDKFFESDFFSLRSTYVGDSDALPVMALSLGVETDEGWVYNYSHEPPLAFTTVRKAVERKVGLDYWREDRFEELVMDLSMGEVPSGPGLAAVRAFLETGVDHSELQVELSQVARRGLTAEESTTRRDAVAILREATVRTLGEVPERLAELMTDDDQEVRREATEAISELADAQPADLAPAVPQLRSALSATAADDWHGGRGSDVEQTICEALAEVAHIDPGAVIDAVPAIGALLEDGSDEVQKAALLVLCRVADEYPDELMPVVSRLQSLVESGTFPVSATSALGRVAKEYPSVAEPLIETFKSRLSASNARIRNNALASLADLAGTYPDRIVSEADRYIELLEDEDDYVRYNATSVISRLACTHPDAVRDATDGLRERLGEDEASARSNACWGLGRLGATAAIADLREVRASDPSEQVEAAAIAALEMVEANECPRCGQLVPRHEMDVTVVFPEWVEWTCPSCDREVRRDI